MNQESRKRLNHYFKPYVRIIVFGCFLLFGANAFLVWIPVFVRRTIDGVVGEVEKSKQSSSIWDTLFDSEISDFLLQNAALLIGAAILYGALLFATRQTVIVASRRIERDIRDRLFEKLLALPKRFYALHRIGDIYVRTSEDVNKVRMYYGPTVMYAANTLSRMGIILAVMFYVNTPLTLWAMIPLPFLSFLAYYISGYVNKQSRVIQEQYAVIAGRAQEAFSSIRLIKAYGREEYEQEAFEQDSEIYRKKKLKLDLVESLFIPMLGFFIGSSVMIVLWKGGEMVIADTLTVGNIAEFMVYVAYLTWPVASLGYTLNLYQQAMASWERIDYVIEYPTVEQVESTAQKKHHTDELPLLEFNNVSFRYPDAKSWALRKVSFSLMEGDQLAIVGRTGSGKSTLVQLIPRLFEAEEGEIMLKGKPIQSWSVAELRELIGYVPQETFLFSDTIYENIAFGSHEADIAKVAAAAEKAQVKENILDFAHQFETKVGERGITLSGGQKQRTAIARALIKNPEIIILDDSLSAVDTKTEEAILNHLRTELSGKTSIMISHRISTVKNADHILVLADGTVEQYGTHEKLMKQKGSYQRMYQKQLLEEELNVL